MITCSPVAGVLDGSEVERYLMMNHTPLDTILVKIMHTMTAMRSIAEIATPVPTSAQHSPS